MLLIQIIAEFVKGEEKAKKKGKLISIFMLN